MAGADGKKDTEKEQRNINEYRALTADLNQRINALDYSTQTHGLVTRVLVKNPEYYTVWNVRRRMFKTQLENSTSTLEDCIDHELQFLVPLLVQFPKCYWIWNYRVWVLELVEKVTYPTLPALALKYWTQELGLVGKMLVRDERNFHGWDYRRQVVARIEYLRAANKLEGASLVESEFEYTSKMVRKALQNFSALHYRSKLIPRLLDERNASSIDRTKLFEAELDMMQEALIDPFNQSAWFYHQYLMSTLATDCPQSERVIIDITHEDRERYYRQEFERIQEILEDYDDCKWVYQALLQHCWDYSSIFNKEIASDADMATWVLLLKRLDPMRSGRWKNLAR